MKKLNALRQVRIKIDDRIDVAWKSKDPPQRNLGRWTDPKALLRRIYELKHPDKVAATDGPGRQWQATWQGRFRVNRQRSRRAA